MDFLETNVFTGFATLLTAIIAISLYYWEQTKKRRDAAKIIIQEIRRAEDIINEYKEHKVYKFTKKIIATNSWAKNVHYFVGDLAQDEIDKISSLYSTGEYLDSIIARVSDLKFDENISTYKNQMNQIVAELQNKVNNQAPQSTSVGTQSGAQPIQQQIQKVIPIEIPIPPPWKVLFDEISDTYEPIYHSSICEKLKKIAKI
ncbi:MAG: hypothetical protein A2Y57_04795 [Candidatus Woykebacteria bacterium RBG_13_40_7b]|uniref:Uncharacterized protein n=1 Tax=Candidatus Woykebacteria bacterium RBG_13_40_7b TaxID=1802594 RepID=A0A1G1WB74_9BACT|nr:MAG: hypothetical protein A2Y57_04795 [Candidatus Woykebacteria bacterium RBG_13_40_7b]